MPSLTILHTKNLKNPINNLQFTQIMRAKHIIAAMLLAATLFSVGCKKDPTPADPIVGSAFGRQLRSLDIVSIVDTIVPDQNPANYAELYQVFFNQPVDHNSPSAGTFRQKAYLFYVGNDRPTVLYTCGYTLSDVYKKIPFVDIAYNMNANLVMVEHRYFGDSKPSNPTDWTYLTISQAAADHHAIIQALKPLLPREWVSTGTSKDGMTSVFLRYFYPDDITVTTAFCSPFITSLDYRPMGRYLQEESGTTEERSQMRALMNRLLQDGERGLFARFLQLLEENNLSDPDNAYTYTTYVNGCIHYFFSFFSYQTPATRHMADLNLPDDKLLTTVFEEVFKQEDNSDFYPYNIQIAKELGTYINDFTPYADLLEGTTFDINELLKDPSGLKPEDQWLYQTYDNTKLTDIRNRFIPSTTCPILFVYSKDDPWTGARPDQINEQYSKMIINPLGIHNHDINNTEHYKPETCQEVMDFIARYVNYGNNPVVTKRAPYSYVHEMNDKFMIRR